jgi:hypothetical protein
MVRLQTPRSMNELRVRGSVNDIFSRRCLPFELVINRPFCFVLMHVFINLGTHFFTRLYRGRKHSQLSSNAHLG